MEISPQSRLFSHAQASLTKKAGKAVAKIAGGVAVQSGHGQIPPQKGSCIEYHDSQRMGTVNSDKEGSFRAVFFMLFLESRQAAGIPALIAPFLLPVGPPRIGSDPPLGMQDFPPPFCILEGKIPFIQDSLRSGNGPPAPDFWQKVIKLTIFPCEIALYLKRTRTKFRWNLRF